MNKAKSLRDDFINKCNPIKCKGFTIRNNILSKLNFDNVNWKHIIDKHVTGIEPGGSKFPKGTTKEQIFDAIQKIVKDGTLKTPIPSKPEQTFFKEISVNGIRKIYQVNINQNTGFVNSVYPIGKI